MNKIVVVGSLNMDLTISTNKLPRIGETVIGTGFDIVPGGKGANQAVAAARLGAQVQMIGCVGSDSFGDKLVNVLNTEGVNTDHIYRSDGNTGVAIITVYKGDNSIILDSGANYRLSPQHIIQSEKLIAGADVMVVQLEIPTKTVLCALQTAHKHGVFTILNPAPAKHLGADLLEMVDVILPNESETEFLTDITLNKESDILLALRALKQKGVQQCVITLGSKGTAFEKNGNLVIIPSFNVPVVDTTAAGDSFVAALAVQLSSGIELEQSLKYCNAVGAITVTGKGAQPSLPTREEVKKYLCKIEENE